MTRVLVRGEETQRDTGDHGDRGRDRRDARTNQSLPRMADARS